MTTYGDIKSGEATMPAKASGLALDAIQIDGGTQSRSSLNQAVVDEYAEAIKGGATFPPIVVFYDGDKHWLADGFHRFHAYQQLGRAGIDADIRQGTRRDAILHSVGANETHGLRRTNEDKRRAVLTLLGDAEWSTWSDREIARRCVVGADMVGRLRPADTVAERQYVHPKTGTPTTMKTASINASRQTNAPGRPSTSDEPSPEAGPQADASLAGTGSGTPADREGRHEGEAASVGLPTNLRNIFDELVALWTEATDEDREAFIAYLRVSGVIVTESNPATGTGGDDVDRSAERASSAVKVGATNSPDGATMSGVASDPGETAPNGSHEAVTGGESAATNSSVESRERQKASLDLVSKPEATPVDGARKGPSGTAAKNPKSPATHPVPNGVQAGRAPEVAPPASGATPFDNPRCLKPETCHFAHSRDCCFDCSLAWAHRPRDEQIRLWAEANEAAEKKGEAA